MLKIKQKCLKTKINCIYINNKKANKWSQSLELMPGNDDLEQRLTEQKE